MSFYLYEAVSSLTVIFAHFLWVHWKYFYSGVYFILFCTSSSFIILVVWWVRWIQWKIIWLPCILIRVSWYIWYRIGWIFVWSIISFRCHTFCWWFLWWWWGIPCSVSKYSWNGYRSVQMKLMYRRGCMGYMYWPYVSQWCSLRNCTIWCVCQIPIPWQYLI